MGTASGAGRGRRRLETSLAAFSFVRRHGKTAAPIGERAAVLLRNARSLASGEEVVLAPLGIPESSSYAVFDLEGLPAQLDELEKIYLWGLQVFGRETGLFLPATAGFGPEGDRDGWTAFLANARSILEAHGELPFVHWATYERQKLDLYVERHGDPDGVAARVKRNLVDLCDAAKRSIVLPLPSYSLKVVERYVGFRRLLPDFDGEQAMAHYIEAVETADLRRREELMDRILAYNREDLEATWVVLGWLKGKTARAIA